MTRQQTTPKTVTTKPAAEGIANRTAPARPFGQWLSQINNGR
jgi:hypothetical protein